MNIIKIVTAMTLLSSVAMAQETQQSQPNMFQVTPSVSILSVPHPLDGSIELVYDKFISIKASKSFEPHFSKDQNDAKINDKSIGARVYPNRGSWFVGLAYGEHEADAHRHETVNTIYGSQDANIYVDVKAQYLTPTTGWKWVSSSGFTYGLELGWIFPMGGSSSVSSDQDNNPLVAANGDYQNARNDVQKFANDYANKGLPNIGLLELGWTF